LKASRLDHGRRQARLEPHPFVPTSYVHFATRTFNEAIFICSSRHFFQRVAPNREEHARTNEDQVKGTVSKVAGSIEDAAGALTGDAEQQAKGKARAAGGDVQAKAGDVVERVRDWAADRPLSAVMIIASVAFVLARLTANRKRPPPSPCITGAS
jgi:uncharacterized protein YjbJ (UPF0337 family)